MNKILYISIIFICSVLTLNAQNSVTGKIMDKDGSPMYGVCVYELNDPANRVYSDENGNVSIYIDSEDKLVLTYGNIYQAQIFSGNNTFNYQFSDEDLVFNNGGENVSNRAKTQSVATVWQDELSENSTHNPYNALYGMLPGLIVLQNTSWLSDASLFVRGKSPLVIVDGAQRQLNYVSTADIESVSVLRGASATAIYGSRGGNGVVVVTTKRGVYKKPTTTINYSYGIGIPNNTPQMADSYSYAQAVNEASLNDGLDARYSPFELAIIKDNKYPYLYPNVDWAKEGMAEHTSNHQLNVAFSGGGEKIRHYASIEYKNDNGILRNTDYDDAYSSQMTQHALDARINLDIDITKTTKVDLGIFGIIKENSRPLGNADAIISRLYSTPSLAFPVQTEGGVWGSDNIRKSNPIAENIAKGYYKEDHRLLQANMKISQNLSAVTEGLGAELSVYYDNIATQGDSQTRSYIYEVSNPVVDNTTGEITDIMTSQFGTDSEFAYWSTLAWQYMRSSMKAKVYYNRNFGKHSVNAYVMYGQEGYQSKGRNAIRKEQSILGVANYNYDNKYYVDVVANYQGVSSYTKGNRFKWYPAVSAAWVISAEDFMSDSPINYLKLRASAGVSGNANVQYELDQVFWTGGNGYYFGDTNIGNSGSVQGQMPILNMDSESVAKYNVGVDMSVFRKLNISLDAFYEKRSDILIGTNSYYSEILGITPPRSNDGIEDVRGFEVALNWQDKIGDFSYNIGGNFSFARNKIIENNEGLLAEDYLTRKQTRPGQYFGLEALGLFRDVEEIESSPTHTFSVVQPGDIKYKDQNGDGKIDGDDVVAMGYSTSVPEIYYGINLGFKYKNFGIDAVFQGVGNYSVQLSTKDVHWPLYNNGNISDWYLKDNVRWTEETKDTANLPRLSTKTNANNFRSSSFWLKSANYLKLRNLNVYYNLPQKWVSKLRLSDVQVYARGNNLFSIDNIDYANCEDIGLNYPDLTSIYLGVKIKF